MKKVYWRPHKVSRFELLLVTIVSLAGLYAVERFLSTQKMRHYEAKVEAARIARRAMEVIRAEKLRRGMAADEETDPTRSGMIGEVMSEITTNSGHLGAKQTSVNPNFAALIMHWLKRLGVEKGDVVAAGVSGSFPAINISVYAALQALEAQPIVISSASASQWGANHPDLLWTDMERALFEREIFGFRSVAVSRGGVEDRALGLGKRGRALLDEGIERSELPALRPQNFGQSVEQRMGIYRDHAGGAPIKVYINVGGGTISVGTKVGKRLYKPGINRTPPPGATQVDSVMIRFNLEGVPVIHLTKMATLAEKYGFPNQPKTMPPIAQGRIFIRQRHNPWLAGGMILVILGALGAIIRRDWGFRLLRISNQPSVRQPPEQMI